MQLCLVQYSLKLRLSIQAGQELRLVHQADIGKSPLLLFGIGSARLQVKRHEV